MENTCYSSKKTPLKRNQAGRYAIDFKHNFLLLLLHFIMEHKSGYYVYCVFKPLQIELAAKKKSNVSAMFTITCKFENLWKTWLDGYLPKPNANQKCFTHTQTLKQPYYVQITCSDRYECHRQYPISHKNFQANKAKCIGI